MARSCSLSLGVPVLHYPTEASYPHDELIDLVQAFPLCVTGPSDLGASDRFLSGWTGQLRSLTSPTVACRLRPRAAILSEREPSRSLARLRHAL